MSANVIIKSAERIEETNYVMKSFGMDNRDPAMRDAADVIAARTQEAVKMGTTESRRYY